VSTQQEHDWNQAFAAAVEELTRWRKEHPLASFNEIEDARDHFMRPVLSRLTSSVATAMSADVAGRCPECQGRLQSAGMRARRLLGEGGLDVRLEREYMRCSACGWAGFPPR
jgi:uncharacterized protein with PIN domain